MKHRVNCISAQRHLRDAIWTDVAKNKQNAAEMQRVSNLVETGQRYVLPRHSLELGLHASVTRQVNLGSSSGTLD
jgi:hypothetical protein